MKKKLFYFLPYIGLSSLVLSSFLLYVKVPFMKTWFYSCGWWSIILLMDGINFRLQGSSFLSRSHKLFSASALLSVPVWLVFELFNISLQNWRYLNLPDCIIERWAGYFIAFATVIPALVELSEFFKGILPKKNLSLFQVKTGSALLTVFFLMGIAFLVLPLVFPAYFFPLVWLCFIFILEPVNYKLNLPSILKKFETGRWNDFWCWCLSGLTAGFIWEFLNFYAGSKWEYSIPYFDFAYIFEMPLLGYFGFIPFALEIFAIFQLFLWIRKKLSRKVTLRYFITAAGFIFNFIMFYLIDVHTSHF